MTQKYSLWIALISVGLLLFSCPVSSFAQQEAYGVGSWDRDSLGNHRAVVKVSDSAATAARAKIVWRRRDIDPQKKRIIVVDAQTGAKVDNTAPLEINRMTGDIIFEPTSGAGTYYVYFMPYNTQGKWYPRVTYLTPEQTADPGWIQGLGLENKGEDENLKNAADAEVEEIQSINWFNSFYPMEVIASEQEVDQLEQRYRDEPYLLFTEKRTNAIRMFNDLPHKWIKEGPSSSFKGRASKGEFFVFQIGLYAFKGAVDDLEIMFSPLKNEKGADISRLNFSSFNTEGTNWDGTYLDKTVPVGKGKVQPLWVGVQIPKSAAPGEYQGSLTLNPTNLPSRTVDLSIEVMDKVIADAGDNDIWRLSRLRWLNSQIAFNDKVVEPFTPIEHEGHRLNILGRTVELGSNGLPKQVYSYFTPEVTEIDKSQSRKLLSSPFQFVVTSSDGKQAGVKGEGISVTKKAGGLVTWTAKGEASGLDVTTEAELESDGYMHYKVSVQANKEVAVKDIRLDIPVQKEAAKYMMGLGLKGGKRPESHHWKWNQNRHQEGAWIGDVNVGFQYQLRDTNYVRPLNTNFYQHQPLNMPLSWHNEGRGGIDIVEQNNETVLVTAYSGKRTIEKGQKLNFVFNLLLTPFKPVDTGKHWQNRYYHAFEPVSQVAKTGASVVNVHHANKVNPYINYPFINTTEMKKYVDLAHLNDMDVKIYNTIRELSNRAPELFALRSMGNEFLSSGNGGGYSWLQEHLVDDYIAGWFVPKWKDAAVVNSGMSRWHNYYIEGLDWLVENMEIDGLYIDDLAFDRTTMKRVRKVLNRGEGTQLIDMHSANQYNERDGYTNSANLYMEHFPYIDRLWFGEYFEYDLGPDYWLIETSGIPFGLMGQMLQGGGNPWRGMVYGMTSRAPWSGNPKPFWRLWDDFGIQEAKMIGYWSPNAPIASGHKKVKATSYVMQGDQTLLVLASWANQKVSITPEIDWKAIGINAGKAMLEAPEIGTLQEPGQYQVGESLSIAPGEGKILIVKQQ